MFFVDFVNKGLELIKISSILHDQDVIDSLPDNLKTDEVPSVLSKPYETRFLTINKLLLILILMIMILSALDWILANVKIHLILTLIMVT